MSFTEANTFECPYCMVINDIEVDLHNDWASNKSSIAKFTAPRSIRS